MDDAPATPDWLRPGREIIWKPGRLIGGGWTGYYDRFPGKILGLTGRRVKILVVLPQGCHWDERVRYVGVEELEPDDGDRIPEGSSIEELD